MSQKADGTSRQTIEMLKKNSSGCQKQPTFTLPTFARVDLEKVNKKLKVKSGRNSSQGKGNGHSNERKSVEKQLETNFANTAKTSGSIKFCA